MKKKEYEKKLMENILNVQFIEIKNNEKIKKSYLDSNIKAKQLISFLLENEKITIKKEYIKEKIENISISNLLYDKKEIIRAYIDFHKIILIVK